MFKMDVQKLRTADSSHLFWMDFLMLIIVFINLLYLFFGFLFQFNFFQSLINHISADFRDWYAIHIFHNVFYYDLLFVGIYITELLFRWIRSIYRKKYDQWWFYPFVHWYDVLMCIPLMKGLNFFGFLRLFGLFYRMQRLGVFDVTKTYFFRKSQFVSEVLVEELSDRVIAKMITMAQNEVNDGSPVIEKIITDVIKPKEEVIVVYLSSRISEAINLSYSAHKTELKTYIEKIISESVKENKTVSALRAIPGIGKIFQETLDQAVGDITFHTIDRLLNDAVDPDSTGIKDVSRGVIASFLQDGQSQNRELKEMIITIITNSLEEVKRAVLVKEWKLRQLEIEKHKLEEKIANPSKF
ncbi:MAG: hypothetical protein JWN78_1293 [Bacteroidota bacterium]|nr:hypothetical protein [Bacteroidota bacterium]